MQGIYFNNVEEPKLITQRLKRAGIPKEDIDDILDIDKGQPGSLYIKFDRFNQHASERFIQLYNILNEYSTFLLIPGKIENGKTTFSKENIVAGKALADKFPQACSNLTQLQVNDISLKRGNNSKHNISQKDVEQTIEKYDTPSAPLVNNPHQQANVANVPSTASANNNFQNQMQAQGHTGATSGSGLLSSLQKDEIIVALQEILTSMINNTVPHPSAYIFLESITSKNYANSSPITTICKVIEKVHSQMQPETLWAERVPVWNKLLTDFCPELITMHHK